MRRFIARVNRIHADRFSEGLWFGALIVLILFAPIGGR